MMQELKTKEEEIKQLEDTNIHLIQKVEEMERKVQQAESGAPVAGTPALSESGDLPADVRKVLEIADRLLQKLPEDVIQEFTHSADFELFESVFKKYNMG
jgi:hypothetical protein